MSTPNPFRPMLRVASDAADVLLMRSHRVQPVALMSGRWIVASVSLACCCTALLLAQTGNAQLAYLAGAVALVTPYLWVLPYPRGSEHRGEMMRRGYCVVAAATAIVALNFLFTKNAVVIPSILALWLIAASAAVALSKGRTW